MRGKVCVGSGDGGAVAPAPVPGINPQTNPHTPRVLYSYAAGTGRTSIDRVLLLEAAPAVVLLLPLSCLVCGFC